MAAATLLSDQAPAAVQSLRSTISCDVFVTGDPAYEPARRVWNGAVDRRPALVVRCRDTDDVAAAVHSASEHGLPLSVRGGGHDWAGLALTDRGLVLDCRRCGQ